ncbi:MAG: hypothetical protein FWF54_09720 [Candidatus Azobacteroides sp.]|nr:hypothetical protein [Candidatus Azobacteroides sp.]
MKTIKQDIWLILNCLCCFLIFMSCKNPSFSSKTPNKQQYRIVREKVYTSNSFGIPEIINDSTARLEYETVYSYDGSQLVSIKKYEIRDDSISYEWSSDTIIYSNSDSVLILWKYEKYGEKKNGSYSMKAKDYFIRVMDNNQILRCDEGCSLIEHSKKHYELSYGMSNGLWCCSFHYFLNNEGYVVKKGVESDTNAHIYIYEYEVGYNPYHLYYTFDVINYK